jgi:Fe2+ or Zn2+ uptake regulation protein
VFRVLSGFSDNGRALELRVAGHEVRYDYNVEPHYHAHCNRCGVVADVWAKGMPKSGLKLEIDNDFAVEGYTVEFYGTCKNCQKQMQC